MNKLLILSLIFFTFKSLNAAEFSGTFYQGNFIIGKTTPKSIVLIDKKKIKVSKQGFFAFGLSKDRKNDLTIEVINDNINKKIIKKVLKKKYKIQRIDGLPKKQVTPPKEVYARIKNDNKLISKARSVNSDLTFFNSKFNLPLTNSIITVFMEVKEFLMEFLNHHTMV